MSNLFKARSLSRLLQLIGKGYYTHIYRHQGLANKALKYLNTLTSDWIYKKLKMHFFPMEERKTFNVRL